jgi:hypothetical protein
VANNALHLTPPPPYPVRVRVAVQAVSRVRFTVGPHSQYFVEIKAKMVDLLNIYMWSLRLLGFCIGAAWGNRLRTKPNFLFLTAVLVSALGAVIEYFIPKFPHSLAQVSASPNFPYFRDAVGRVVITTGGYMLGLWLTVVFSWCKQFIKRKSLQSAA